MKQRSALTNMGGREEFGLGPLPLGSERACEACGEAWTSGQCSNCGGSVVVERRIGASASMLDRLGRVVGWSPPPAEEPPAPPPGDLAILSALSDRLATLLEMLPSVDAAARRLVQVEFEETDSTKRYGRIQARLAEATSYGDVTTEQAERLAAILQVSRRYIDQVLEEEARPYGHHGDPLDIDALRRTSEAIAEVQAQLPEVRSVAFRLANADMERFGSLNQHVLGFAVINGDTSFLMELPLAGAISAVRHWIDQALGQFAGAQNG